MIAGPALVTLRLNLDRRMLPHGHFEDVFAMAHDLHISVAFANQVLFLQVLGLNFALRFRRPAGGRPAFILLWKNDPIFAAVDGWLLDDDGGLITDGEGPHRTLGHLVFTSSFQHALYLSKARS